MLEATRAIAKETDVGAVLRTIMRVSLENAGAERGFLILVRDDRLLVKVRGTAGKDMRFEALSVALGDQEGLAHSIVQYVARTAEPVLLDHACEEGMFTQAPHVRASACKSLLCLPILNRGSLVAISYLENNQTTAVFDRDRLDVLTLLMGQAAVSVENALLKELDDVRDLHFKIGGSLPAGSPVYVRREADDLLADHIRHGELCFVFNARQMGKSSLRVRTAEQLGKAGIACVSIDLTTIGAAGVTVEQWYAGIARALVGGLHLQRRIDLRRWWRDQGELSPVQRLDLLLGEEILTRVETPIALLIDEVDSVLGLDFSVDDFFALIRSFYDRRAENPDYQRLSFILLGVATPADLIRDTRRTPFNIGRAIPLSGFRFEDARILAAGLTHVGNGERLLRAVLDWTHGQPFLTQKVCQLIAVDEARPTAGKEREWVANLVRTRVIDRWRHHDEPEHFKTIESRILNAPEHAGALLARYREILEQGEVASTDSPYEATLVLSGLVMRSFDRVRVGNPLYAEIFDRRWIEEAAEHP